jgi:hypothetical protein
MQSQEPAADPLSRLRKSKAPQGICNNSQAEMNFSYEINSKRIEEECPSNSARILP